MLRRSIRSFSILGSRRLKELGKAKLCRARELVRRAPRFPNQKHTFSRQTSKV